MEVGQIDIAAIAQQKEEESRLSYEKYVSSMKKVLNSGESSLHKEEIKPVPYATDIVICPEPVEIIGLFKDENDPKLNHEKLMQLRENFAKIAAPRKPSNDIWFNRTDKSINLRPGAIEGDLEKVNAVPLGDNSVHGLVVGRTGAGKSVFLNVLILNMLTEYPPWELNLYLADFKKVELSRYATQKGRIAPHLCACAATSEIRYVVSLLDYLVKCMVTRQQLFQKLGLTNIAGFREKYNVVLPRVLLLVDEFQQLFLEATNKETNRINELLTMITKLGRATGFHLLFASQEMSGTLSGKVFANFKAKFALPCDAEVSSMVLGNSAAADLHEKGFCLVNTKSGAKEDNVKYRVPFIDNDDKKHKTGENIGEIIIGEDGEPKNDFADYLKMLATQSERLNFAKIIKYYDEDFTERIEKLESFRKHDNIKAQIKTLLNSNKNLLDSLILGPSVVYKNTKIDFESFFLEKGKKNNIGAICTKAIDAAYILKLLVANFANSTQKYQHYMVSKSEIVNMFYPDGKKKEDLSLSKADKFDETGDLISTMISDFEWRKIIKTTKNPKQALAAIRQFIVAAQPIAKKFYDENLSDAFIKEHFDSCKTMQHAKEILMSLEDSQKYAVFANRLDSYIKFETEPFPFRIFWIIGSENIDGLKSHKNKLLEAMRDSTEYNMLFVIISCNEEDGNVRDLLKQCNYLFINAPTDSIYNRYGLNYTKKEENSLAMDFKICNMEVERAFKKFRVEFDEGKVPELNFDEVSL
ncbi:MAG: FtsK/SpoIIIE domain-containing protein [Defluviitaleaceae bacterium]|nr:FtsK/SpoIIIE domain-containing protein [Defluviitaleaceae bacterium]